MNKNGAIIIVENDSDDQEMFSKVLHELNYKNEIIFLMTYKKLLLKLTQNLFKDFLSSHRVINI